MQEKLAQIRPPCDRRDAEPAPANPANAYHLVRSALESLCSRLVFCKPRATTGSNDQEITAVSRGHPMSWITIVWSMNAAACLTLATIYLLVWSKQRERWAYLVLSCNAVAGAALTAFELWLVRAQSAEEYAEILRWTQLPVCSLIVTLVVFVLLYLRAGRLWLAWSVCSARTLALILNFVFVPNLSYRQITGLRQVAWWGGETVSVPVGVTNPWILVAQLSLVLLVIFFVDATITAWRQGDRQRAFVVGGALIFFSALAIGQVALVVWGIIQVPFLACFSYLGLIAAMGYEVSIDMLHRAKLSRQF